MRNKQFNKKEEHISMNFNTSKLVGSNEKNDKGDNSLLQVIYQLCLCFLMFSILRQISDLCFLFMMEYSTISRQQRLRISTKHNEAFIYWKAG